jgi:hypothetical protein
VQEKIRIIRALLIKQSTYEDVALHMVMFTPPPLPPPPPQCPPLPPLPPLPAKIVTQRSVARRMEGARTCNIPNCLAIIDVDVVGIGSIVVVVVVANVLVPGNVIKRAIVDVRAR